MTALAVLRTESATTRLCAFHVGEMWFGVDIASVEEVVRDRTVTTVPLAPPVMAGVLNLRGQIVSAIDLRARLGMPATDASESPRPHLVVRSSFGPTSLVVDRLDDVMPVVARDRQPAPSHLSPQVRAVVAGIYPQPEGLLIELDVERTVDTADIRTKEQ